MRLRKFFRLTIFFSVTSVTGINCFDAWMTKAYAAVEAGDLATWPAITTGCLLFVTVREAILLAKEWRAAHEKISKQQ